MVRLEVVDRAADLEQVRRSWSELLGRSAADEPTMTPDWLLSWWRVFGDRDGRRLRVGLVEGAGGRLLGLVPLCARTVFDRRALPSRRLELLGSGEAEADEIYSEYIGVVAERGRELEVIDTFVRGLTAGAFGRWDELRLVRMNGDSSLPHQIARALARQQIGEVCQMVPDNSLYAALPDSWEAYLGRLRPSTRAMARRSLRAFETWAGSPPRLERVRTEADLADGLSTLQRLHRARWQAEGKPGVFASDRFRRFHRIVAPLLLRAGALELSLLHARSEPVAALYNIVWNDRVQFYQCGRRPDLPGALRVGLLCHLCAIQDAIASGRREYDFLGGGTLFKRQLSTSIRQLREVRLVRRSVLLPLRDAFGAAVSVARAARRELRGRAR